MAKRKNQPKKSREAKEGAFDASAQVMTSGVSDFSSDTKNWIFNAADEMAAQAGMIFDGQRGQFTCDWIESNCYLWQGEGGGQPMKLIPYQRDFLMRLYSWVKLSPEWGEKYIRRFSWANLICAKKNGKSPLLAANGIYLTCADGEKGQNVYTIAVNGKQAGRTQEHAIHMVEKSPSLSAPTCVINRTTSTITHTPTDSKMTILAGDDSRGAKANEGINGSIMIDELHVVDRELQERVRGAGISRKEPLNLAVSTAGDDPSSYGFQRTEHGRGINSGRIKDPRWLHVEYAAPQNATDEDIDANLEEFAKAANPAFGYTVHFNELAADWESSKGTPREKNRCKQYRFNIWIGSTSPWLDAGRWDECRRIQIELIRDRECVIGIDLSRTRDMTSCVFNFNLDGEDGGESEQLGLWPMFWLPRETAQSRKNLFDFMDWAERGDLVLTDGNVVDYSAVEEDIYTFAEENQLIVTDIYFDQHYAEEFTQRLSDRLNANRTAVAQHINTLSPLCKEFERRLDGGNIWHNGNKVMDWQVGHVQIKADNNQNIRPVKPDPNSGKSIDGIMAAVNTFTRYKENTGDAPSITFF